jgi:hypothetical protein
MDSQSGTCPPVGSTSETPNGRFDYVKYDDTAQGKQEEFKSQFKTLEGMANAMMPDGRAKSIFMTKIEEAYMWAGKALRDEQVYGRRAVLQENRCNS